MAKTALRTDAQFFDDGVTAAGFTLLVAAEPCSSEAAPRLAAYRPKSSNGVCLLQPQRTG